MTTRSEQPTSGPATGPRPFAFVLMPFSADFDDLYSLGIKPACVEAGAYAERVDEQLFQESILQRIYNQITKADIIIADMTGRNPNVFYETGYAHALGKPVILLTREPEDIPFDLKHYPHIIHHGRISDLRSELEKRVRWLVENPGAGFRDLAQPVQFFVDGESLDSRPTISLPVVRTGPKGSDSVTAALKIDVWNSPERVLRRVSFGVAVLTSPRFERVPHTPTNIVKAPDGRFIHLPDDDLQIVPGGWKSVRICFVLRRNPVLKDADRRMTLRIFNEHGVVDYPFDAMPVIPPSSTMENSGAEEQTVAESNAINR